MLFKWNIGYLISFYQWCFQCYASYGSSKEDNPDCLASDCGHKMQLVRHVSFVDCPGHDILMATMLNGAAVMDAAMLLVAGNETCPQPQTSEHLAAVEIMKLKHIIILQVVINVIQFCTAYSNKYWMRSQYYVRYPSNTILISCSCVLYVEQSGAY